LSGAEQAAIAMRPADQCLDTDNVVVTKVELRLVNEAQVELVDRASKFAEQSHRGRAAADAAVPAFGRLQFLRFDEMHFRREGVHTAGPRALRRIHRDISLFQ
jgi:hypothetical protein